MPSPSDCPNELFKKMAKNDLNQNSHLSQEVIVRTIGKTNTMTTNQCNKVRFLICMLGLIGLAMSQMSRSVLNITITSMSPPKNITKSSTDSCPWPIENEEDQSYNEQSNKDQGPIETFDWSVKQKNILLGAFFYSYPLFMAPGGWLAETYGAKYVLLTSVAVSGLINLLTPWIARNSFNLLFSSRIVMGAIQAGAFPAMYALFNEWLTMSEATIFASLIKVNLRLGALFGTALSGIIEGWPNVFYTAGYISLGWSLLWVIFATSQPRDNKWVSEIESAHIVRKKLTKLKDLEAGSKSKQKRNTPWLKIVTAPSVIALIVIKLTFNFGIDFIVILMPSYLKAVHHMTRRGISIITGSQLFAQTALIVLVGWFAKFMVKRRPFGLTKTSIRILFQSTASYGIAICMLLIYNNCDTLFLTIILQLLSFLCMFTAGGETMLPYDLSERYPATIMAVANSIANFSVLIITNLDTLILGDVDSSYRRWNILMLIISVSNFIGASVFNLLVRAEPIDFDDNEAPRHLSTWTSSDKIEGNSQETAKNSQYGATVSVEDKSSESPEYMTKVELEVPSKATAPETNPVPDDATIEEPNEKSVEKETIVVEGVDSEEAYNSEEYVNLSSEE